MKKILLLALPIMVMCAVSCEKEKEEVWTDDSPIIQFKDQNFLEKLLDNTGFYTGDSIDRNADGQISQKEASVVKYLAVNNNYIRCIDEIVYFTALEYLDCGHNQLTSLDLSKNTALWSLSCGGNPLTKIILNRNHMIQSSDIQYIIEEYGDIIEYVD